MCHSAVIFKCYVGLRCIFQINSIRIFCYFLVEKINLSTAYAVPLPLGKGGIKKSVLQKQKGTHTETVCVPFLCLFSVLVGSGADKLFKSSYKCGCVVKTDHH